MPLDRAHLNVALRIMVPAFVIFFAGIGLNYTINPFRLGQSPMLRYADNLMPLPVWGSLFLTCASLMAAAMVAHHRSLYRYALLVGCFSMVLWAVVAIVGAFIQPISFSAWVWPAGMAASCYATNRSLERNRQGN